MWLRLSLGASGRAVPGWARYPCVTRVIHPFFFIQPGCLPVCFLTKRNREPVNLQSNDRDRELRILHQRRPRIHNCRTAMFSSYQIDLADDAEDRQRATMWTSTMGGGPRYVARRELSARRMDQEKEDTAYAAIPPLTLGGDAIRCLSAARSVGVPITSPAVTHPRRLSIGGGTRCRGRTPRGAERRPLGNRLRNLHFRLLTMFHFKSTAVTLLVFVSSSGRRGGAALLIFLTCLLLRLAFAPSNLTRGGALAGRSYGADTASIELGFYAPAARPVRLALDGTDALAVPVYLTRSEVRRAKEAEILAARSRTRSSRRGDRAPEVPASDLEGWTDGGSWGLRIVSLKPPLGPDVGGDEAGRAFAPRAALLSPLVAHSTHHPTEKNSEGTHGRPVTPDANPIRLLPVQIPIETTRDGGTGAGLAPTKDGTLPGVVTVWSDGAVSLHVVTADVPPAAAGRAEPELRQLWRTFPFEPEAKDEHRSDVGARQHGHIVEFDELGLTFASNAGVGDHGAILIGGR